VIILGGVVVLALIIAGLATQGSSEKSSDAAARTREVFLEPAAAVGSDPFTDSAATPTPSSTVPLGRPVPILTPLVTAPALGASAPRASRPFGLQTYAGGQPGLYGGTLNQSSCDQEKMVAFLAADPTKARAWADAQRISEDQVPTFIRGLTPVILRGDTRVSNFGFSAGRATPRQSVLQAGTAMLIDQYGEPQARCACGNPLNAPENITTTAVYKGPKWPEFNPGNVTLVVKSTRVNDVIRLIDIITGAPFEKGTGPDPGPDRALPAQR
jgi:hypothetical protein